MHKVALVGLLAVVASALARAPLHLVPTEKVVKDSYIVVLHDNVTLDARQAHINKYAASNNFALQSTWEVINGYHAIISEPDVLRVLLEDEHVSFIEQDQTIKIDQANDRVVTQTGLPAGLWGLGRIWQASRGALTSYHYWESAGTGVDCYILDTGINPNHVDFTGRHSPGQTFVTDSAWPGTSDGNGHGTHVASTTAGTTYGVAKKCTLIAVKVLTAAGSGTNAGVINGVNFVLSHYQSRRRPSVANMSLGGGASAALDNAVTAAINGGVTFVVAAGNDNANACNYSPARTATAVTVGSTTNVDARSSFSNVGTCVDIFAPGSNILGAWYGSATATSTISGTSMASPHVAGAAALLLGRQPALTPAQVKSTLIARSTANLITSPGTGSPNRLLFTSTTQ